MRFSISGTFAALALAALAAGCDFHGDPFIVHPEFDDVTTFEADLGEWIPRATGLGTPPGAWEIVRSAERASEGTRSARLRLANGSGEGRVFLERRYAVEKDQLYDVDIAFDFASADFGGLNLWRVIAGADPESPTAGGVTATPGDTGNGRSSDEGFVFLPKSVSMEATSDLDGELFVYVGVQGTSPFDRTYYVDNLRVTLTRKGITTARP